MINVFFAYFDSVQPVAVRTQLRPASPSDLSATNQQGVTQRRRERRTATVCFWHGRACTAVRFLRVRPPCSSSEMLLPLTPKS